MQSQAFIIPHSKSNKRHDIMYRYMFLHKFYIYRCNDLFLFIKPFHKAYMIYSDHIVYIYIMEAITFFFKYFIFMLK